MPPQYRYITNISGNNVTVDYFDDDGQTVKIDLYPGQRVKIKKDYADQINEKYPEATNNLSDGEDE